MNHVWLTIRQKKNCVLKSHEIFTEPCSLCSKSKPVAVDRRPDRRKAPTWGLTTWHTLYDHKKGGCPCSTLSQPSLNEAVSCYHRGWWTWRIDTCSRTQEEWH